MEKNITFNDFTNLKLNIANILDEDTNAISVKLIIKLLLSFKEEQEIGLKELKLIKNNIINILNEDTKNK